MVAVAAAVAVGVVVVVAVAVGVAVGVVVAMSFYDHIMRENTLWGGVDGPAQSRARIFLDLYALQAMSPEERLAKSERLEAAFAKIKQDWKEKGFANDEI